MIYGYCRISTPRQNLERQVRNIRNNYTDAVIVREIYTGTKVQGRKEFTKLLKKVAKGDTLVFDSVSRMSVLHRKDMEYMKSCITRACPWYF